MKIAWRVWIESEIELVLPTEFEPRARNRIVAQLRRWVALGQILKRFSTIPTSSKLRSQVMYATFFLAAAQSPKRPRKILREFLVMLRLGAWSKFSNVHARRT